MSASSHYAYVMKSMTKTFPGAPKPVLSNINLQFYRGSDRHRRAERRG